MTQPKIMDWNKGLKHFSIDGFEHTISFHTWLKSLIVIWFWKETFQCSFIRFMSRLQILNVFTLKEKIQENEMHFVIWCFISAKEKLLHKLQKKYVPFIQMVPYIRVMFKSCSIDSEEAILIGKTENVLINLQSLTMTKSEGRLKKSDGTLRRWSTYRINKNCGLSLQCPVLCNLCCDV